MRRFHFIQAAAVALALVLLYLGPDHDLRGRAVARTGHVAAPLRPLHPKLLPARPALTPRPAPATAVVTLAGPSPRTVPRSFLGISTEYWTLPLFEAHAALLERALNLLRTAGGGPLVLRVGGDSADHTFWHLRPSRAPRWVVQLSPKFLRGVGQLVNRVGVRLILDLNLVTDSPLTAAQWAGAADADLPRGSILGYEVGNEPDLYARRFWSWTSSHPAIGMAVVPKDLTPASYARDFQAYSSLLAQAAPHIPLIGPAVAHPASGRDWVSTLIASRPPHLGMISGHVYPYSACAHRGSVAYPTIPRVLSEAGSAGIAGRIAPTVRMAHRAGLPFRLTEMNSVTCGGMRGVSDTFATALWAPDALFEMMRVGVDGVNIHVRARAINAAFSLDRQGMTAHPLFYGMMLFSRTLGPGARLAAVHVRVAPPLRRVTHLKVWAVSLSGGRLHVLILDKGGRSATVDLRVPGAGVATVQRLLAPSIGSRSGVTLAGQHVGTDARWQGPRVLETVRPGPHGYVITVPRMSAALVGLQRGSVPAARAPANESGAASRRPVS